MQPVITDFFSNHNRLENSYRYGEPNIYIHTFQSSTRIQILFFLYKLYNQTIANLLFDFSDDLLGNTAIIN